MLTEFASLQLSREELREVHTALLQRAMVEDGIRAERGQSKVTRRDLLEKFEMLLGETEDALHALDHVMEDELWEHAWYAFSEEWAWFRASQDVMTEGGASLPRESAEFQKAVELKYQKQFEAYIAEIDMRELSSKNTKLTRQPKAS